MREQKEFDDQTGEPSPLFHPQAKFLWLIIVILVIQTAVLFLSMTQLRSIRSVVRGTLSQIGAADRSIAKPLNPSIGPERAGVTIVVFSDFQSSDCLETAQVMKELVAEYGDRVRFVHRNFPLAGNDVAIAGECAHEQERFWEMYAVLFANYGKYTRDDLIGYAVQIGLDQQSFANCLNDGSVIATIEQDVADGKQYEVEGPPAIFINDKRFLGELTLETLQPHIDAELTAIEALEKTLQE